MAAAPEEQLEMRTRYTNSSSLPQIARRRQFICASYFTRSCTIQGICNGVYRYMIISNSRIGLFSWSNEAVRTFCLALILIAIWMTLASQLLKGLKNICIKIGYRNLKISRNKIQFDLRSPDQFFNYFLGYLVL